LQRCGVVAPVRLPMNAGMNAPPQERETLWFSSVMPPIAADMDVQEAGALGYGLGNRRT
jgi:hypothetical protein